MKVKDGPACVYARCPAPKCNSIVHEAAYKQLTAPATFEKYLSFLHRSFVDDNAQMKWCPAPGCTNAIKCERTGRKAAVVCKCGFAFCFRCADYDIGDHNPVDCEHVSRTQCIFVCVYVCVNVFSWRVVFDVIVLAFCWVCVIDKIVCCFVCVVCFPCLYSWRNGCKRHLMNPKTWNGWWPTRRSVRSAALLLRRTEVACTWLVELLVALMNSVGYVAVRGPSTALLLAVTTNAISTMPLKRRRRTTRRPTLRQSLKLTCSTSIVTNHTKTQGYVLIPLTGKRSRFLFLVLVPSLFPYLFGVYFAS